MRSSARVLIFLLIAAGMSMAVAAGGDWLNEVPTRDRGKTNPFHDQPQAIQAGQLLFAEHCAQCHGTDATGSKKRPSLRTDRVQTQASDGALHWLLVNGNVRRGMPTWSKLPDQQLWQIVSFVKSLSNAK